MITKEDLDQEPKEVVLDQEIIMAKIQVAILSLTVLETLEEPMGL